MFEDTQHRKPKINFTPLIDIIFLLVMFFMLTTSFIKLEALDVSVAKPDKVQGLPKRVNKEELLVDNSANASKSNKPISLMLDASGIWLDGNLFELTNLTQGLADRVAAATNKKLMIQVNYGVDVQTLIRIMDIAQIAGAEDVEMHKANLRTPALQNVQLGE